MSQMGTAMTVLTYTHPNNPSDSKLSPKHHTSSTLIDNKSKHSNINDVT